MTLWSLPASQRSIGARAFRSHADRKLAHSITLQDGTLPTLDRYASATLVRSPRGKAVELHYFPGRTAHRALVIGGVHGTEYVSVEVTRHVVTRLRTESGRDVRPFFTAIVVPALYPDNLPASHGGERHGRRATRGCADPNRQFPVTGVGLEASPGQRNDRQRLPRDSAGRIIEPANVALIELIRRFRPQRIVSVHAIRNPSSAGIYCDPHRGTATALGNEAADLAQRMHKVSHLLGGHVPGSMRGTGQYPHQSGVSAEGVSLGEWGSHAVDTGPYRRDGIPVITIELKREWPTMHARRRRMDVEAFMLAIRRAFLEP